MNPTEIGQINRSAYIRANGPCAVCALWAPEMMIVQANTINYVHMHVFRKRKEKQLLELKDSEVLCELCFRKRKYKQEMKPAEKAKFYASKRNEG